MAESLKGSCSFDDEGFDDWMIESIKSYKNLHMYELQQVTRVIEWISNDAVCVAGCKQGSRNEILELKIPDKLLENSESDGLNKERDFKLKSGGFSDRPIHCLKHIPSSRLVITSGPPDNSAQVWTLGSDDSDVIRVTKAINPEKHSSYHSHLDTHSDLTDSFLMGSVCQDIQLVDVRTGQPKFHSNIDSRERICGVRLLDSNTCIACSSESGELCVIDMRLGSSSQSQQSRRSHDRDKNLSDVKDDQTCGSVSQSQCRTQKTHDKEFSDQSKKRMDHGVKEQKCWSFDVCGRRTKERTDCGAAKKMKLDFTDTQIFRLTADKKILVNDLRNIKDPLATLTLQIPNCSAQDSVHIKSCTSDLNFLSVSGFDNRVYIYDIQNFQQGATGETSDLEPIFVHGGHMTSGSTNQEVVVLEHTWHPWKPHLVMSAASDGSLHAWEWLV